MKELKVIVLMFIVLLLTACSKNEDSPEETQPVINVYVYSPEHPVITRGDVGNVNPIDNILNESLINSLQIWVFEHKTGTLVSYYEPETVRNLNDEKGVTYQLNVSDDFANAKPKPNVDVYVVANVASCGLSFNDQTTRDLLEGALIGTDHFGLSSLTTTVPKDGLPMSGVLRDVAVTGSAPVFKISSVKLTRAVSKVRFIFSRDNAKEIRITNIKLAGSMIPTAEYLFLLYDLYRVLQDNEGKTVYVSGDTECLPHTQNEEPQPVEICMNSDPLAYTYQPGQNAQEYETLINNGVTSGLLTQVGPFYLRESDKILEGTIYFQVGTKNEGNTTWEETVKTATFSMKAAGDFSRNHTWIVYAYYGVDGMQVITVYSQEWHEMSTTQPHNVYNW